MDIIARLTLRHLSENRKRTIVTILGIATSTALISAILLGVFSFFKFFGYLAIQTDGNVHAAFYEVTKEQALLVRADERIASAGVSDRDPEKSGVRLFGEKEDRFRIGNIAHADPVYYSDIVVSDYDGTLPANSSEIAVEEKFLTDNDLMLKVGDTLTFEQGNRYYYDEDGEIVYLAGSYQSQESFNALGTETCTVTAILHGNKPTSSFDILRGMDADAFPALKHTELRINLKNCDHTAIRQIREIAAAYGISKCDLNTEYMLSVFAFEGGAGAYRSFFALMAIALCIVVVTSVVLIVNSIGMSLTERMRYLGMLASVGATARQKRFSIYYEGLFLGLIGIPLGLLMGYIGTKVTLAFLGSRLLAADIFSGVVGMRGSIPIACSPYVILAIIAASFITIFLSVLTPALRAARIMPIDALRQSSTVKVRPGKLRVNPIIHKLFGYEGELAYKNIKRNGAKGTVITVSIAVSVIMFLTISYFCDSVERVNQFDFDLPYQLVASCSLSEGEKLREELLAMDEVDRVFSAGMIQFNFAKKDGEKFTPANKDITDPAFLTADFAQLKFDNISLVLVDDEDFKALLGANGLSEDKYFGGTLRGVLLNNFFHNEHSGRVFNDGILGQSLHYDEKEGNPPAVEIGDFVSYDKDNYLFRLTPRGTITVYAPFSLYYEKAGKTIPEEILTCDLGIVTPAHDTLYQKIYALLEDEGYHNYSVSDLTHSLAQMNAVTLLLKTAMYGFTILLTLITIANIVNTISTGILLRRKEFAMYKSVGMASGGFKKMIRLETFLYGIRALVFGLPLSVLLSFLMFRAFDTELYAFEPDWFMYIAVTAAVFAVVGFSMLLSVNRLKDDSIIEALKYEMV